MKKELLDSIDGIVENICKWANEEFKEKESYHNLLKELEETDDSKEKKFNKRIELVNTLSKILQSRAELEKALTDNSTKQTI